MESNRDVANGLIKGEICGFSSWRLGVGERQAVLNRATYVCGTSPGDTRPTRKLDCEQEIRVQIYG